MRCPSDGSVGGRPMPRKRSVASSEMAFATCSGRDDDEGRQAVRQEVAEHDARSGERVAGGGLDVFLALSASGGAADGAGE